MKALRAIGDDQTKLMLALFIVSGSILLLVVFCGGASIAEQCLTNASKNVKPISQFAPDQYNSEYQVRTRGDETCGEAAMVMIFNAYAGSQKYTIAEILQKGKPYGLFVPGGGTVITAVPNVAKLVGLQAELHPFDLDKIIASANSGNPVMLLIKSPYTPGSGHFIVVLGGDAHNVRFADSGANSSALMQTHPRQWLLDHKINEPNAYVTFKPQGASANECSSSTTSTTSTDSTKLADGEALKTLTNAGIAVVSSGNCNDRNSFHCTSLDQVRSKTIAGIIAFQKNSSCKITITGGTEYGHASSGTYTHWNGYKLDIAPTACVTSYIHSHFTYKGLRGGDNAPMYDDSNGNRYADEGSHWDIIYY